MEVIPDGVIDESFGCLRLTTCLVFEHNVIIPPTTQMEASQITTLQIYLVLRPLLLQYFDSHFTPIFLGNREQE